MPSNDHSDSDDSEYEREKKMFCLPGFPPLPLDEDGRTRYVMFEWSRKNLGGKTLVEPSPVGKRTPNGLIWGHHLVEFFWIDRLPVKIPHADTMTVWSRSMIKEFGEFYEDRIWGVEYRFASPHFRKPWPIFKLKVPEGERVVDYFFDQQIEDFYRQWLGCPCQTETPWYRIRFDVPNEEEEEEEDGPQHGRPLKLPSYRPTYEFRPYAMPDPLTPAPRHSPFSVEAIPKLEEDIPSAFMPDYLLVHDPHDVTHTTSNGSRKPVVTDSTTAPPPRKYRRVLPQISKADLNIPDACKSRDLVAHLYLHRKNRFGMGHHSLVYRAPLSLPPPLSAQSRNGKVSVTVKLAMNNDEDREMLRHEGSIYNKFPKHMSEDWCGYNMIKPIRQPVPVGPVVPKFYGLYEPVGDDERYPYNEDWSPILLVEECGTPIEPGELSVDER